MQPRIAVAVSGGIDSLAAAYLLNQQHPGRVTGFHFLTGYEQTHFQEGDGVTLATDGPVVLEPSRHHPIQRIGHQLDIPIRIIDCRRVFQKTIIDDFVDCYRKGLTPNPCVRCNTDIKFGVLLDVAREQGFSRLATGHYASIMEKDHRMFIGRGADPAKDQSYFLGLLKPESLPFIRFPLGDFTKDRVRDIIAKAGLVPISDRESQDICFVPGNDYAMFLERRPDFSPKPGEIVDTKGRVLGVHGGLHRFTIGQRRGINCPAPAPYYVVALDVPANRLVVGGKEAAWKKQCRIRGVRWFIPPPAAPMTVLAQIRYRHRPAPAQLIPGPEGDGAVIRFQEPQAAITPGQAAVCYVGGRVAAGGWIDA